MTKLPPNGCAGPTYATRAALDSNLRGSPHFGQVTVKAVIVTMADAFVADRLPDMLPSRRPAMRITPRHSKRSIVMELSFVTLSTSTLGGMSMGA